MTTKRPFLWTDDEFTHRGYTFRVTFTHDDDAEPPWEMSEGHGPVSEWTSRAKRPGERVLFEDDRPYRRSRRYYDVAEATRLANRDGWGPREDRPGETKRARAARAVEEDFQFLREWATDQWEYLGVTVEMLTPDGGKDSLWGVESYGDYHQDVAYELADGLADQMETEAAATVQPY